MFDGLGKIVVTRVRSTLIAKGIFTRLGEESTTARLRSCSAKKVN